GLRTDAVEVTQNAVLVVRAGEELIGVPVPPIDPLDGLIYEPRRGGARMRENRLQCGSLNDDVVHATRFGMVNALVHVDCCAAYLNGLLAELGRPRLPVVR